MGKTNKISPADERTHGFSIWVRFVESGLNWVGEVMLKKEIKQKEAAAKAIETRLRDPKLLTPMPLDGGDSL